jgi:hypothetical protein
MRNFQQTTRATKALTFLVGAFNQFGIQIPTWLLAIQNSATAAVFAFVGLGARTVFSVFDYVAALAAMAMANFYYHPAKVLNQLEVSTTQNQFACIVRICLNETYSFNFAS